MHKPLLAFASLLFAASCATAPVGPSAAAVKDLAPSGKLRAAINFGNPVLAQKDPATGQARGVSVNMAQELGRRLGVPVEMVFYDAAGKVADAAKTGAWDIAFVAIDPARATDISFSPPYVIIEGSYIVRNDSPLRRIDEFDREGLRISVGNKSAYDLYLTRTMKKSTLVRVPTSSGAVDTFVQDKLDAAAGVKAPLLRYAAANPGVRVIDGRFMAIEQAMGTPRGRDAGAAYLREFVEDVKASGFVARGLQQSGQTDAQVAPPAR